METATSPYIVHIFVCVNDRHGARQSCADGSSPALKDRLKEEVEKRGWKPRVRVSHCGCMGLCAEGPNVILYPQRIWFRRACLDDAGAILAEVEQLLQR